MSELNLNTQQAYSIQNPPDLSGWIGNLFSQSVNSAVNTASSNFMKNVGLANGLGTNLGQTISGSAVGLGANLIGHGISQAGGNSMLSRGIGQGVATGIGTIGGQAVNNLFAGKNAFLGISDSFKAIKNYRAIDKATRLAGSPEVLEAKSLANAGAWNLAGLGGQIIGTGLQAAFGPSKEYGGKYGGITKGMDTAYDVIQGTVGLLGPVGTGVSGIMALNKGLSNIFGSTDGMTKQDAILGSAFMPAPVKWLNMAGAKTTGEFYNQSWQNTEKADSFMQNAFGDLGDKFKKAREEANKTYGTFSRKAYNRAQANIDYANRTWDDILAMADERELQNIRSQYMSSINNQRYSLMINGGFNSLPMGKEGMKIFNNATNHNMALRLLSGAALIDNKQMILCARTGEPLRPRPRPLRRGETDPNQGAALLDLSRQQVYLQQQEANARAAETNARHALQYSNLATNAAETVLENSNWNSTPEEQKEAAARWQEKEDAAYDSVRDYAHNGELFMDAVMTADMIHSAAPFLKSGFRWVINKAGLLKVPGTYYHGSPISGLKELSSPNGIYLASTRNSAKRYGGTFGGTGSVYKFENVDLGNRPLYVNGHYLPNGFIPSRGLPKDVLSNLPVKGSTDNIVQAAQDAGYTSVIFKNVMDPGKLIGLRNLFPSWMDLTVIFNKLTPVSESKRFFTKLFE